MTSNYKIDPLANLQSVFGVIGLHSGYSSAYSIIGCCCNWCVFILKKRKSEKNCNKKVQNVVIQLIQIK